MTRLIRIAPLAVAAAVLASVVSTVAAVPGALAVSGSNTILTLAGSGTAGAVGDGGQATSAQLNLPLGVAVDGQGNVYVADCKNNTVRQVSNGLIRTVAGTGMQGDAGDGGQATSAQLYCPTGVAVDAQGNLYISDTNHRVREVSNGIIRTVAGTGALGFSGDGEQATAAQLYYPQALSVDAQGNLYIADTYNHRIRKVTAGGTITTVAGTGTVGFSGDGGQAAAAQLAYPYDVAVDAQGNLYIADSANGRIRKVTTGGTITTVAGNGTLGFSGDGGAATSAQLSISSYGVAVDAQGNLYIADTFNHRIRKVTAGGTITTIAGGATKGSSGDGGPAGSALLSSPSFIAVDQRGNVYFSDSGNNRLREIVNKPPVASFTVSTTSGRAPLAVSFDGSASTDPDGQVSVYAWDFGDGAKALGPTATHTYAKAGTYTANLTVTDDSGAAGGTSKTITVTAPVAPPKLTVTSYTIGRAHAGGSFTVSMLVKSSGKRVRGGLACTAKLNGKTLPVSRKGVAGNATASCTWSLPRSAAGAQLAGSISETYKGAKATRSFSVRTS